MGWKQVGGDMIWERHGVVLAKVDAKHRQVELVRIEPWLEHDKEAAVSHGLYLVDEETYNFDDLEGDGREIGAALSSAGLSPEEYLALAPEHKAVVLASYAGYQGDSRSTDQLAEALPARPEDVEFWGGRETSEKLESYDTEMRREALVANFDTHLTFGRIPNEEALEFALGGASYEMSLQGADALAFEYSTELAGVSGATDTPREFAETVQALLTAPLPEELDRDELEPSVERVIAEWERRYGDLADEERGITETAAAIASSMMETIGFTWF